MKKYCLALDLVDNPEMIAAYEGYHQSIRPEIKKSILDAGITQMEIFRIENRLFMIMETEDDFSFEKKNEMDLANLQVQEWEKFIWKYQQALPSAKEGEKWLLMKKIFALTD